MGVSCLERGELLNNRTRAHRPPPTAHGLAHALLGGSEEVLGHASEHLLVLPRQLLQLLLQRRRGRVAGVASGAWPRPRPCLCPCRRRRTGRLLLLRHARDHREA